MNELPAITDQDEWDYLESLKPYSLVGSSQSLDQGYYAHVLQRKYQRCGVQITITTFQILQPGFRADKVQFTPEQRARQRLFTSASSAITKDRWLRLLERKSLLPSRS